MRGRRMPWPSHPPRTTTCKGHSNAMKTSVKILLLLALGAIVLIAAVGIGSVYVSPPDILTVLMHKLFQKPLPEGFNPLLVSIIWNLRLPRALLAFWVGGALAVCGNVMQSVLKNPLASSYTLGVSAGASLGAGAVIFLGLAIPVLGMFSLPLMGLAAGLLTVFLAIGLASKLDKNMQSHTIILTGMVFSLFVGALLTLMMAMSGDKLQQLVFWQMGSFAMRDWSFIYIMFFATLIGLAILLALSRELDILTFGEEQAKAMGVSLRGVKWTLLATSACLTGIAVSFVGVIGFIDLVAPHVVRKLFGSRHRLTLPMCMILGGTFMVFADLVARTAFSPIELPVGAVTALIGAPFFGYIYFGKRRKDA